MVTLLLFSVLIMCNCIRVLFTENYNEMHLTLTVHILKGIWVFFFLTDASRYAYIRNVILNGVRQHNCFVTQGNYIGYMFRL